MRQRTPEPQCLNCGALVTGNFCAECGQEAGDRIVPVQHLLQDVFEEFLKWDAKILGTLAMLLFRPGFLTVEFIAGRRARYLAPFKLLFAITTLYLLLFALTGGEKALKRDLSGASGPPSPSAATARQPTRPAETAKDPLEKTVDRGLERTADWLLANPTLFVFLMVPLTALYLQCLHRRSGRLYVEHLVFAVHTQSFTFAASLVEHAPIGEDAALGVLLLATMGYMTCAMHRVYGIDWWGATWRSVVLAAMVFATFIAFVLVAGLWPQSPLRR